MQLYFYFRQLHIKVQFNPLSIKTACKQGPKRIYNK